jgi:hypothetical protein
MNLLKELPADASHELYELRIRNETLIARLETTDLFGGIAPGRSRHRSQEMPIDITWALQNKFAERDAEQKI